jgi:hypothetical protein
MPVVVSEECPSRLELAFLANARGLTGRGAEIGVHQGEFSCNWLARWAGQRWCLVDPYPPCPGFSLNRTLDENVARAQMARFGDRVEWHKTDGVLFLQSQPPGSLDVVYIDALHALWAIEWEINAAWDALRPGGMLSGHDFDPRLPDVGIAVRAFAAKHNLTVWITQDFFGYWSWYTFKPE